MFMSSSVIKQPPINNSSFNNTPLPSKGTKKRNPDEFFTLKGRRSPIVSKPWKYKSNSQLTMGRSIEGSASSSEILLWRSTQSDQLNGNDSQTEDNEELPEELCVDESEKDIRELQKDSNYDAAFEDESLWYINPVHKSHDYSSVDWERFSKTNPLQASVAKSHIQGLLYDNKDDDIDKKPIEAFDMTLFRDAENEMLSCRTITALTSPYQYKLARLKMERLKIEEERLLKMKATTELERIRGPTPKWYEMRDAGFHIEARKHNEMLASKGHYEDLMKYRHGLLGTLKRTDVIVDD